MGARRFILRGACLLAIFAAETRAHADEPPIVVEPTIPDSPPPAAPAAPSPVTITLPSPAPPAPSTAPAPAPPPAPRPTEPKAERTSWGEFGLGPTYFGALPTGSGRKAEGAGVVLEVGARVPVGDHFGVGFRLAWGLTEFERTEAVARPGYKIGQWTTRAYGNVWEWAGEGKKDERPLRYFGAMFAFVFLIFPYAIAIPFYVVSPIAASTYLETDLTADYDFDPRGTGPYAKTGVGLMAYVPPDEGRIYGGVGPTAGIGYRTSSVNIGLNATYLPPGLHGGANENVVAAALTIGFGH